jgi:hypothetical protein
MSWQAYKIVLRLQAPMHMGRAKLGNLQITRPYVHGKALWGALTARMTRDTPAFGDDYPGVGKRVNEELAFSYFYPATGQQIDLWPWDDPDQFAWRYLGSYASTALNYSQNSATEGSLHEAEFIVPTTRDDDQVNLIGYIFEQEGCALQWREALPRLQLGGERTYGWGRVTLKSGPSLADDVFGYQLILKEERPIITVPPDARLLAHALAADFDDNGVIQGHIEPLVGRETVAQDRFGIHHSAARICYVPGTQVKEKTQVQIGSFGIWEAIGDI